MADLERPDPLQTHTEEYVVSGWSALERDDLEQARAALHDLYSADPTHPALPLLAAGIRRIRPKPLPWRAAVLLIAVVVAGIVGVRSWMHSDRMNPRPKPASTTAEFASIPPSTAPASAEVGELGTTGHAPPGLLTVKPNQPSATLDEDVIVRQAIQRFEQAYRTRWGGLAFEHCDVSREGDEAKAICVPRDVPDTPDVESDQVWTFSLRKAEEGGWRIASVQPPPNSAR